MASSARLSLPRSPPRPRDPHILFVCRSEKKNLPVILSRTIGHPVLTVSDMEGFAREGGIIGMNDAGGKIKFEINTEAAGKAELKISSQLLKIARIVQ